MILFQVMRESRLNVFQCVLCTMKVSHNILDDNIKYLINHFVCTIRIMQYSQFVVIELCKQQNKCVIFRFTNILVSHYKLIFKNYFFKEYYYG